MTTFTTSILNTVSVVGVYLPISYYSYTCDYSQAYTTFDTKVLSAVSSYYDGTMGSAVFDQQQTAPTFEPGKDISTISTNYIGASDSVVWNVYQVPSTFETVKDVNAAAPGGTEDVAYESIAGTYSFKFRPRMVDVLYYNVTYDETSIDAVIQYWS